MSAPWMKSVGAVVAGFFATAILSVATDAGMHGAGVFPPPGVRMSDALFVLPAVYRAVFTVVGGAITAALAPNRPMRHVWILAGIGLFVGTAAAAATWDESLGPLWYAASIPLSAIPCIWAGGRLAAGRVAVAL